MAVQMAVSALDFDLAKEQSQECPASPGHRDHTSSRHQRPVSPTLSVSSSSSSSGGSSSESSDSSSEGEGEGEESESNITPTLEKVTWWLIYNEVVVHLVYLRVDKFSFSLI